MSNSWVCTFHNHFFFFAFFLQILRRGWHHEQRLLKSGPALKSVNNMKTNFVEPSILNVTSTPMAAEFISNKPFQDLRSYQYSLCTFTSIFSQCFNNFFQSNVYHSANFVKHFGLLLVARIVREKYLSLRFYCSY